MVCSRCPNTIDAADRRAGYCLECLTDIEVIEADHDAADDVELATDLVAAEESDAEAFAGSTPEDFEDWERRCDELLKSLDDGDQETNNAR